QWLLGCWMTVLPYERDRPVLVERHNRAATRMAHDLAPVVAPLLAHRVNREREDAPAPHVLARKHLRCFLVRCVHASSFNQSTRKRQSGAEVRARSLLQLTGEEYAAICGVDEMITGEPDIGHIKIRRLCIEVSDALARMRIIDGEVAMVAADD